MAQTNLNIRIDENLKKEFDEVCDDLGLTMTTAFTVFAKTVVREQRIPFEIKTNVPNKETLDAIKETQEILLNPSEHKGYSNVEEMFKEYLCNECGAKPA